MMPEVRVKTIPRLQTADSRCRQRPHRNRSTGLNEPLSVRFADNPRTGGVSGNKGASLGIGRTESLCLKRGNHFVENALSKTFIKLRVTLQPSEEQGTTKHIDQQFWIRRRLQLS